MAEAPKTGGKKVLGMSPGTAAAVGAGVLLVAVLGYKYLHRSSSTSTAPVGTTAGGTIPASLSVTPGSVTAAPTTFTQWLQKAYTEAGIAGYGYATLSNDVNSWLTGQCVSANGYKALNTVLPILGAPLNRAGTTSKILVCSTRGGTTGTKTTGGTTGTKTTGGTKNNGGGMLTKAIANLLPGAFSTATKTSPYGKGATGWTGALSAAGSTTNIASFGLTYKGSKYNVYEPAYSTWTANIAALLPKGANITKFAATLKRYNPTGAPGRGIVVPNTANTPVP